MFLFILILCLLYDTSHLYDFIRPVSFSTDEIKDTIPDESIKAKVGSLFSSLFSTTQTQQSNQVTQSKSGAHPKISAWGGEDLVPNSADFLDL